MTPASASRSPFLDQRFDASTLYQLRAAVAAHVAEIGLPACQANDILIAVHELASNAIRHGHGHGRLCAWRLGQALAFTVRDGDAVTLGAASPAPGEFESLAASGDLPWPMETGHGLWLVSQVASYFAVHRDDRGATATVAFQHDGTKPGG
ncbi:MAG TPA: ATP-binding protein [Streptosporangiaceae bacterium]|nr:ATP-binding protein [Streptosporangiaceae bacterium]